MTAAVVLAYDLGGRKCAKAIVCRKKHKHPFLILRTWLRNDRQADEIATQGWDSHAGSASLDATLPVRPTLGKCVKHCTVPKATFSKTNYRQSIITKKIDAKRR